MDFEAEAKIETAYLFRAIHSKAHIESRLLMLIHRSHLQGREDMKRECVEVIWDTPLDDFIISTLIDKIKKL